MRTGTTTARTLIDTGPTSMVPAAVGAALGPIWALLTRPSWTAVLLLLSPFVLVPLGLRLAASSDLGPHAPLLRPLAWLAPLGATTAATAFALDPGLTAAALTLPWFAYTVGVAAAGVGRLLSRPTLRAPGIAADVGLLFLAVGGAWLTISRAGRNPLGFSDAIVELTAVHFHYAGFALPIVAGFVATRLRRSVVVPAAVMAAAGMATAGQLLWLGLHNGGATRALIVTAGSALLTGMALALGWAWSLRFGWSYLGLASMAATHGSLNALGFGLLALLGLNRLPIGTGTALPATGLHLGRPSLDQLRRLAGAVARLEPTSPVGLLDRPTPPGFRRRQWQRRIPHGDLDRASRAIGQWAGHDQAGIRRFPKTPGIAVGETLALAIPVGPISVSATCRIVDVIDGPECFGFTYATLPHHAVDGEESFVVARDDDGSLTITVTAVWRPTMVANHVCPPLTRWLQNRAINRYLAGIATAPDPMRTVTST